MVASAPGKKTSGSGVKFERRLCQQENRGLLPVYVSTNYNACYFCEVFFQDFIYSVSKSLFSFLLLRKDALRQD